MNSLFRVSNWLFGPILLVILISSSACTFKNCAELHRSGQRINGIYTIKPDNSQAFDVYCDQTTDGGGWTVFQRRLTGSVDFNRSWADYKHGFGSFLDGEFWLGLDKILRLTKKNKNNRLRVDLGVDSKTIVYAEYKWFGIANETADYQLNIGNLATGATVSDSLRDHNGSKFRTWDQKHSICPEKVGESWWFPEDCTIHSNLNGIYGSKEDGNIHWGKLDSADATRTPKTSEMKIRPAEFKRREGRRTKRGTMKERV